MRIRWECSRYHHQVDALVKRRTNLIHMQDRESLAEEELSRHLSQIEELAEIERMNRGMAHEFITDIESAVGYVHENLDLLEQSQGDKIALIGLRQEMNRKLLHSALMDYKRILQNAWYEVFSALDKTIYRICQNYIRKIEPIMSEHYRTNPGEFDFWFTPFHPDFKFLLGKYVLSREGRNLSAEDYLFLFDRKLTEFGIENLDLVLSFLKEELDEFEDENGRSLMESHLRRYKVDDFRRMKKLKQDIHRITRDAENRARQAKNLPKVGEGWKSEMELFNAIRDRLDNQEVIHNGSPAFLGKQHLDIWIPRMKVGVEYQGEQHFRPIAFFGGKDALEATRRRDERKRSLCSRNGVAVVYVRERYQIGQVIKNIMACSRMGT